MKFLLSRGYTTLGLSHVTPDTSSKHEETEGCGTLIVMAKPRCVHLLAQVIGHRSNVTLGGRSKRPENETTREIFRLSLCQWRRNQGGEVGSHPLKIVYCQQGVYLPLPSPTRQSRASYPTVSSSFATRVHTHTITTRT